MIGLRRNSSLEVSRFPGGLFDSAGSPYYYLTDFQGNNIGVYDKIGKLVQRTDYYASGEPWLEPEYGNGASGNCPSVLLFKAGMQNLNFRLILKF